MKRDNTWSKWFCFGSIYYGVYLLINPFIFDYSDAYGVIETVNSFIGGGIIAIAFILVSIVKLVGIRFQWNRVRAVCLGLLMTLWSTFTIAFIAQYILGAPNAETLLGLTFVFIGYTISSRERFR